LSPGPSPGTCFSRLLPRIAFSACLFLGDAVIASGQQPTDTSSSAATSSSTAHAKPKKVWTNDDVAPASASVTVAAKAASSPTPSTTGANAQLATQLRVDELKRLQAGELSGDAGRQLHKRYSSAPIPEQIAKLEEKRKHLRDQIEVIYEEARKKGILSGQLREP